MFLPLLMMRNIFLLSAFSPCSSPSCHSLVRSEFCSAELLELKSATQQKLNRNSVAGDIITQLLLHVFPLIDEDLHLQFLFFYLLLLETLHIKHQYHCGCIDNLISKNDKPGRCV